MNGFEKYGLKHTSPSQINMWAEDPAAWCAKYIFGKSFSFGVAPLIGTLVESVVADVLCGGDYAQALERAQKDFLRQTAIGATEKERERISDISAMADQAIDVLKEYGEPEFIYKINGREQQKVELLCRGEGWELPVIGFLDFVYPKHNLIIDLKTTLRCPSEISISHARQAAVYAKAKDMDCKMLYVTPKKSALHGIVDLNETLNEIKTILNRQEKFLSCLNEDQIKNCVPVNSSSFYWTNDAGIRKELYGI